jgi:hypothetical protein
MSTIASTQAIAETATTNTESQGLINIVDRNTVVWWGLLLTSAALAMFVTPWGCLFWLLALLVDDVLLYAFGTPLLFDSQLRMRRNYQWMHNLYDNTAGSGRDLGFNLVVDGELSQRAKYEHMAEQLGLEPGMARTGHLCSPRVRPGSAHHELERRAKKFRSTRTALRPIRRSHVHGYRRALRQYGGSWQRKEKRKDLLRHVPSGQ